MLPHFHVFLFLMTLTLIAYKLLTILNLWGNLFVLVTALSGLEIKH